MKRFIISSSYFQFSVQLKFSHASSNTQITATSSPSTPHITTDHHRSSKDHSKLHTSSSSPLSILHHPSTSSTHNFAIHYPPTSPKNPELTTSLRAARIVCRKSLCVSFQVDLGLEDLSSCAWCLLPCFGRNSASSVPCILCLAESKGFLRLLVDCSHIFVCFSSDCGIKVRAQIAHGRRMGGTSVSIYRGISLRCCGPSVLGREGCEGRPSRADRVRIPLI